MKPKMRIVPIVQLVLDKKNANKGTKRGRELLGSLSKSTALVAQLFSTAGIV